MDKKELKQYRDTLLIKLFQGQYIVFQQSEDFEQLQDSYCKLMHCNSELRRVGIIDRETFHGLRKYLYDKFYEIRHQLIRRVNNGKSKNIY